ncbi:MAG: hypothetical protein EHM18_11825 [Acidobacteria bacterium]|nr:MAG: hypothetical protein EHM18_11825 [Acidobacteriota bacterium]
MSVLKQKTLTGLMAVILAAFVFAPVAADNDQQQYVERFERTVPLAADGGISLHNIAGDIEINTWGRGEVRIEALKVSRSATVEQARANADEVTIEVAGEGKRVDIETKYPRGRNRNLNVSVEFKLTVPEAASVETGSVSGSIRLTARRGNADLNSVSGDVQADRVGGTLRAKSVSGNVRIAEVSQEATAESVSGAVEIRGVGGETKAKSVSGDVTVEHSDGPVSAESMSGDVDVIEAANAGLDVDASTFSGRIQSDFELAGNSEGPDKHLRGSVNGGGKSLKVRSFSGRVSVTRK